MSFRLLAAVLVALAPSAALGDDPKPEPAPAAKGDNDVFYALGLSVADGLKILKLTEAELKELQAGLADGVLGKKPRVTVSALKERLREILLARSRAALEAEKKAGEALIAQAAAEPGAVKSPSGLVYRPVVEGTGPSPGANDVVKVHYHGTLRDGTVFDSSVQRGKPVPLPLHGVIPCWTEGAQRMKVGGKAVLTCPSDLAYGERGRLPAIPPGATLRFEIELLEILPPPK